jgi:hypothetical protein
MNKVERIVVAIPGVLFFLTALQWIFDPAAAAEALGLPLLDGLARSTEIGDLGAFFLACSGMILYGAVTAKPHWLRAPAILVGSAAFVRTLAWILHGADFAAAFIAVEVVVAGILFTVAGRLPSTSS